MLDVRGIQNCEFIENCSEDKWIGPLVGGRPTTHQATRAGTEGQIYSTTHFWTFDNFFTYIHVMCSLYVCSTFLETHFKSFKNTVKNLLCSSAVFMFNSFGLIQVVSGG